MVQVTLCLVFAAGNMIQELIQILGDSHKLSRPALHLLLQPHLTQLSLRPCAGLINNNLIQLVSVRCKFLTSLDLHSCHRVCPPFLAQLVEGLPRLVKVCLSDTQCDTSVLSSLSMSCQRLCELDISHCKKLTPSSLLCLGYSTKSGTYCCQALRVLLVQDFKTHNSQEKWVHALTFLLLALPNLEQLSNPLLPDALRLIHGHHFNLAATNPGGFPSLVELANTRRAAAKCNGLSNVPYQLKVVSDPGEGMTERRVTGDGFILQLKRLEDLQEEDVLTVGCMCPGVEEMAILLGNQSHLGWSLLQWPSLTHLTLHSSDHPSRTLEELLPLLTTSGERFHFLSIQNVLWNDGRSLQDLLTRCPNLHTFQAHFMPRCCAVVLDNEADVELPPVGEDMIPLPKLQNFTLFLEEGDLLHHHFKNTIGRSLVYLLRGSLKLETLFLCGVPYKLDLVFETILVSTTPPLPRLKAVSLCQSNVTPWGVSLLLRLGNTLKTVDLSHCRDVTCRDHHRLQERVRKERLDINIKWQ
ncbi:Hypothetical predicted protein [Pelobates cultripes]|uniref:Uncharacterized protein n=1 Tax=Pelobates cultripes TaxID=61616 RepID=A0AAD1R0T2_PELCU|nr:Hypothetical predicted protein [Pelobates cultripes]